MELKDKVAVVTGGSRGIGRAIVLQLLKAGARVAFCYEANAAAAKELLKAIKERNGLCFAEQVDVSQRQEVQNFIDKVVDKYGRLDIQVNNAGIQRHGSFIDHKEEDWRRVIEVNLTGCFHCSQVAARIMVRQKYGKIINLSSRMYLGAVDVVSYAASKAGIVALTKSMAMELGPFNINVNCIAPGAVESDMAAAMPPGFREERIAVTPLRRFALPQEIGDAVVFLASERSAFITGEVLHITGGLYG